MKIQNQIQVGWNVGHNLTIGGRELAYSGTHLKGIVTDVQVWEELWLFLSFGFYQLAKLAIQGVPKEVAYSILLGTFFGTPCL